MAPAMFLLNMHNAVSEQQSGSEATGSVSGKHTKLDSAK